MPTISRTFYLAPSPPLRDEIVQTWIAGIKSRKWKMIENMQPVDWDDVRRKAIEAWFPKLMQLNPRYAIKYAARLSEVEGVIWKERWMATVSTDAFDKRLEERKNRFKEGGIYTVGAMQTIPDIAEFVFDNLLKDIDPSLGRYIKAALVSRFANHAVELMFVSIGVRNGYVTPQQASVVVDNINATAEAWWGTLNLPAGFSITETWNYRTDDEGCTVTFTITRPE